MRTAIEIPRPAGHDKPTEMFADEKVFQKPRSLEFRQNIPGHHQNGGYLASPQPRQRFQLAEFPASKQ